MHLSKHTLCMNETCLILSNNHNSLLLFFTVAEWLEHLSLVLRVPGPKHSLCTGSFNTVAIHPAVNEYLALLRAVKVKGCEEEGWRPTSVTPVSSTTWFFNSLTATAIRAMGQPLNLPFI